MFKAQVVADSLSPQGDRLVSLLVTFPRIILAEVNTHRMLGKNTSSSRAIPFKKMVEAVRTNPFIPIAWQKEHSGMQGSEYFTDAAELEKILTGWMDARDHAVSQAEFMTANKVTKQLANRLMEPFLWTTMLITGPESGWENFFNLRCPSYEFGSMPGMKFRSQKDAIKASHWCNRLSDLEWLQANTGQAEIHMMKTAELIYDAMQESEPEQLKAGEWHIPFKKMIPATEIWSLLSVGREDDEVITQAEFVEAQIKISTAMGARTSYTMFDYGDKIDYANLIALHDRLLAQTPPHSSPLEHIAKAMSDSEYHYNVKGCGIPEHGSSAMLFKEDEKGWCRNLKGFIPYRHIIESKF